jgi:hypothetical protein
LSAGFGVSQIQRLLSGRTKTFSDELARALEVALDIPPLMLDQHPSHLLESKAAAEHERVCAINTFLGENRYVDRYWNVRDLIEKSAMKSVEFAAKTGFHSVDCTYLFSKKPTAPISDSRARIIEDSFGLDSLVLDQRHERNTLTLPQDIPTVSTEAIDILGTGAYLNRYLNIKSFFLDNHLTYNQIDTIVGFKMRASDKLADPPKSVIDSDSARAFEKHFKLEPGAVDQFIPGFDYAAHQSSVIIGEQAFDTIKTGVPLYRYVNTKRALQERGIALIEFVPMMERTRAYVYALLSDSVASKIGDQSARRIEQTLGLKPLSLDVQRTFRVAKVTPGVRQNRTLSPETDLQP